MNVARIAAFSLGVGTASGDGKTVTRPGKLFETGVWSPGPNRPTGFSLSAAEARATIGHTVPLEIEHVRSRLDGKLGTATFTAVDGDDLNGFLTLPKVLNDLLGPDEPLPVSVVWDTVTKKPLRVGIVLNPAISDAQVTAAFSAAEGGGIDAAAIYAARTGVPNPLADAVGTEAIYAARNRKA